ncbi:hypothetical protein [Flavobacterium phragmitis]|uniref:Uncharacterized protein n=1 Tax=Flavobacterium phragmitis TaxID=739143 RepID=A0A1I1LGJ6_9FLAO|nr:hypothetical protein [Flavobacterium phragmitis]SFC72066.1 hypothetical protein SAMN05216297_1026 [Flavobacterium phragmitis]
MENINEILKAVSEEPISLINQRLLEKELKLEVSAIEFIEKIEDKNKLNAEAGLNKDFFRKCRVQNGQVHCKPTKFS